MFKNFSPILKHMTLKTILAIVINKRWTLRQFDVESTFLHGKLKEIVHMKQPLGYKSEDHPNHIYYKKKAIYELHQAPRTWYEKFNLVLYNYEFFTSQSELSLFIFSLKKGTVYVLLYVDDIILTRSCSCLINNVVSVLVDNFKLKDLSKLSYFLGISIDYFDNKMYIS
jgi:hypothetical protein